MGGGGEGSKVSLFVLIGGWEEGGVRVQSTGRPGGGGGEERGCRLLELKVV